ncbi:MAG: tetratricopeptide repeat protein, partial [Elusimicrobia bacterium]|nr:tetratricopeptide repeat protein [Elusimicrobiota bacterium]MBD3411943.1 tetratricopeptide repeat protein [Elusimicrobiota bacterium]
MRKYILFMLVLIPCGLIPLLSGFLCAESANDREKQAQIEYLYKMGTEYYYQGKYAQAIKYWEAVLDIDPQQTQPPALIENAREQIQKESGPVYKDIKADIEKGDLISAQEKTLRLLDLDPTNTNYKAMMKKINKLISFFPELPKDSKLQRLIIKSISAYLFE